MSHKKNTCKGYSMFRVRSEHPNTGGITQVYVCADQQHAIQTGRAAFVTEHGFKPVSITATAVRYH